VENLRAEVTFSVLGQKIVRNGKGRELIKDIALARLSPPILFTVAFCAHLALISTVSDGPPSLAGEPQRIARSLMDSGRFADPYVLPTGYTAHLPPVQPILLSWIYRSVGLGPEGEMVRMVLNSFLLSLAISLFPLITAELNLSWQAGMWAGLAACWPSHLGEVQTVFGEPLTVLLVTFAFYLALRSRPLAAVAASGILAQGLLLGFITLLNPVASLGVAALLPLSYLLAPDKHTRSHLLRSAAVLGIATLMVAPWTLRNYARLGGLVVVRSNFGLELHLAHTQLATPTFAGGWASTASRKHAGTRGKRWRRRWWRSTARPGRRT